MHNFESSGRSVAEARAVVRVYTSAGLVAEFDARAAAVPVAEVVPVHFDAAGGGGGSAGVVDGEVAEAAPVHYAGDDEVDPHTEHYGKAVQVDPRLTPG